MVTMVGWAITLSLLFHALTGELVTRWYARRLETAAPGAPELMPGLELSTD
jgi:hypothetical protein